MQTISRHFPTTQALDEFLDAFDRLAPDHVSGGQYRKQDIERLRGNLMFIKLTQSPKTVDEWVALTEEHYVAVNRDVAAYREEQREHFLTAEDYGLPRRAA